MIHFDLLHGLSFMGGVNLLLSEGYIEEPCIEKDDESCKKILLYPYSLYKDGNMIDRVYHIEYCNLDEDGEYEAFKAFWSE